MKVSLIALLSVALPVIQAASANGITNASSQAALKPLDATAGTRRVASPKVTVVDTTGCGDAFAGALISRVAAGDELVDAVATAVRVGAYAATGKGAQPSYPTSQQLAGWTP